MNCRPPPSPHGDNTATGHDQPFFPPGSRGGSISPWSAADPNMEFADNRSGVRTIDAPPTTVGLNHEVPSRSAPLKNTATTAPESKVSVPTEPMALPDAQRSENATSRQLGEQPSTA